MLFADAAASIMGSRRTRDGYLVASMRFARTGIYDYRGYEVGRPDLNVVKVYRPIAEVFSAAAMRSFALKPVTNDHPADSVSAETWKTHAVGHVGAEIRRDGDYVSADIVIQDRSAIEAVEGGKRELSAGYDSHILWQDGTSPDGQAYQAIMTDISGNHIAIVDRGRAGRQCRIGSPS